MGKFRQRRRFGRCKPPPPRLAQTSAKVATSTKTTPAAQTRLRTIAPTPSGRRALIAIGAALACCCWLATLAQCQQQQQQQQAAGPMQLASQLQRSSAYANSLVNSQAELPQGAPLARQRLQQSANPDLGDAAVAAALSAPQVDSVIASEQQQPQAPLSSSLLAPAPDAAHHRPAGHCQLPPTWMGKWYQANKEPIRVTQTDISDKGQCRDKKGDKYLLEARQQQQPCLVCLVINERHLNVLQYKESSCQPIPQRYLNRTTNALVLDSEHTLLDSICSDITGDAQLESLFRLDTPAIECPISGKYHFSYDNCREPLSSLDSCIDKKQLNFKFSACPDVPGSESKTEVLKCYADWSEGNNFYMIGRLEHASNHQDKGRFRCFIYERLPDGSIQMSQTLEESCYGLTNAFDGPKPMRLTSRQSQSNHKCHFPSFIQSQSESWLSVDNSLIYMFNQNSTRYQVKETKEGNVIEEATCLQQFIHPTAAPTNQAQQLQHPHAAAHHVHQQHARSSQQQIPITSRRYPPSNGFNQVADQSQVHPKSVVTDVVYLVQITKNCFTMEYCVRFYRRSSGIIQIDYFSAIAGLDGIQKCRNAYNGSPQTQIITSTNLENQRCPFEGAYTIEAPLESDFTYNPSNIFMCPRQSFLTAQCDHPSRLRIHYKCTPARYMAKNLYCLGSWQTNGLVRLLLADDERQRYSAWYRDYGTLQSDSSADPTALAQTMQSPASLTRSQQLMGLSAATLTPTSTATNNQQYNSLAPIVDLQIALITPLPTIAKPMQVRLTRRNQCSDLRGYSSQGSQATLFSAGASMPSYAPSATASSASSIVTSSMWSSVCTIMFVTLSSILMGQRGGLGVVVNSH